MRWLIFLLAFAGIVSAQETLFREVYDTKTDTHVELTCLFSKPAPRGYLPFRLRIANQLTSDRSVSLSFTSSYGNDNRLKSSFSFNAPAEKISEYDLLVPLITAMSSSYDGPSIDVEMSGSLGAASRRLSSQITSQQPSVLLSEPLYTPNASALDSEATKKYASAYSGNDFSIKFDAKQLPDDWRAFSGFDSILMTDADWTGAAPGARSAILAWVRLGGQLVIFTQGASASSLGLPEDRSFGSIILKNTPAPAKIDVADTVDLVNKDNKTPRQLNSIVDDYSTHWPLQDTFGKQGFNYTIFIIILIAFGVIVGPVNLFVFAKSGQRHRLFITTPLISLAASLLLITLILFQDGFGGRGARMVLMEVRPDNGENAAYLRQEQFTRTGVLTRARFTLDDAAAISPVPLDSNNRWARLTNTYRGGNGRGYTANFRDGKLETSGDWFQSRSEQGQILEAVVPTRGRIERSSPIGNPQLLSTFDFSIASLFYRDSTGQWWRADNVQPGNRFSPTMIAPEMVKTELDREKSQLGARNQRAFVQVRERNNCFIAITEAAPGVETYRNIKWQQTHTILTGPVVNP